MPPPKKVGPYALKVRVNHGRWIVDCPACGSAQLASRTDRRFFCVECANVAFDGDWVAVEWPKQEAAIERALKKRTLPQNRNWEPGETVADLQDEIFMDDALIAQIRAQAGGGGD